MAALNVDEGISSVVGAGVSVPCELMTSVVDKCPGDDVSIIGSGEIDSVVDGKVASSVIV